jgi:RNA polymerase sigma factor (TIGR02999 family)
MGEITQLLDALTRGDAAAGERFYAVVYGELKKLAFGHLRGQATLTNLDAPSLVHETFMRLVQRGSLQVVNRRAFFGYASNVMRSVVIDYVRERAAQKRGGDIDFFTLNTGHAEDSFVGHEVDALHEALGQLLRIDERLHDVVEMRYFGGLSIEEVAEVMGVSTITVKRDWQKARAFLFRSIRGGERTSAGSVGESASASKWEPASESEPVAARE